ncbi:unnamed protein product [Rotaria sordida]|uniref:Uncharacterized protein n=1 Tax=Rotaria sordida TaxID=392033 RepID=A0A814B2J7_9BILA|nr:unnamed protein product [Rotaria sordida]CAF3981093.1 unnamed protein product [Rotaria sordida]
MASSFFQTSLDDNTTTYDNQSYITTINTVKTEKSSINNIVSTTLNDSFDTLHNIIAAKPNYVNKSFIIELICSIIIIFVIAISALAFVRHYQHSQTQQKKQNEYVQNEKLSAHPFEEVLVAVSEPQSVEMTQTTPTAHAN